MPAKISEEVRLAQLSNVKNASFLRWDGVYKNCNSRAIMLCSICLSQWSATVDRLVYGKTGCPSCSGRHNISKRDCEKKITGNNNVSVLEWPSGFVNVKSRVIVRCNSHLETWGTSAQKLIMGRVACKCCIKESSSIKQRKSENDCILDMERISDSRFLRWVSEYRSGRSYAEMMCAQGHTYSARVTNILSGKGCKYCAISRAKLSLKTPEAARIRQINDIDGVKFVKWLGVYENNTSKAVLSCDNGHTWCASIASLICGSRCPSCANYGFNPDKRGVLYLLRSSCGRFVKVGITNYMSRRIRELEKGTPFDFELCEAVPFPNGADAQRFEKHILSEFRSACFRDFDGATEWLIFNPTVLEYFRQLV